MATPAPPADRPLRKDAERNRRRILEAAREVFAEHGLGASLDDIAKHAGVGIGTVYRRFPHKEALIDALFDAAIDQVVDTAREALEMDDPFEGLVHVLVSNQESQAADRGLRDILFGARHDRRCATRARERILPVMAELLGRAQAAGTVRTDVTVHDIPLAQMAIGTITDATRDVAPDAWRRLMTIMLDGLRPARDAPTPMPAGPLDDAQLEAFHTRLGHPR